MRAAKIIRPLALLPCLVALASLCALLAVLSHDVLSTTSRVRDVLEQWESRDLPGTVAWGLREYLACFSWLGPFRPVPLEDPLAVCGMIADESCHNFPLMACNTRKLLRCLEEKMKEAEENHAAFQDKLIYFLPLIFGTVILGVWVLLKCIALQGKSTCEDRLDITPSAVEEIDKDMSDDLSSGEYEDCQEACVHPGSSQDISEDMICNNSDITNYCLDSSPEVYEECKENITLHTEDVVSNISVLPPISVYPEDYYMNKKKQKKRVRKPVGTAQARNEDTCLGSQKVVTKEDKCPEAQKDQNGKNSWPKVRKSKNMVENKCLKAPSGDSKRPGTEKRQHHCPAKAEAIPDQQCEEVVEMLLDVPPQQRRLLIGRRGDTIRFLQWAYPAVHVSVPPPDDLTSRHVALQGPKRQVAAAADYIMAFLLKTSSGDSKRPGTEKRLQHCPAKAHSEVSSSDASVEVIPDQQCEEVVVMLLDVPPQQRRLVIGRRGDTIRLLQRTYPAVHVSVPPPDDLSSSHVALQGPKRQVAPAAEYVMTLLQGTQAKILEDKRCRKASLKAKLQEEQRH